MIFNFKKGFDDSKEISFSQRANIAISSNIINENSTLHFAYSQSIIDAGANPIIIPANCNEDCIAAMMTDIDGVLLSGGDDIDGQYFGEDNIPGLTELNQQRDYYEFMLLRRALDCGVPILGICRGCQVVNVALGGSIYQDLPSMYEKELLPHSILSDRHLPVHEIDIIENTNLSNIIGVKRIGVNSRHHQAIKKVADSLRINSVSTDGVIEGVEGYPLHKIIALQSHPENMATTGGRLEMKQLFNFFVNEANLYRRAKKIHIYNHTVDSHCDTPMLYKVTEFDFSIRNSGAKVDLVKMCDGWLDTTITAAYIPQNSPRNEATNLALSIIDQFKSDLDKNSDKVMVAHSVDDAIKAKKLGKKSAFLAIENGLAIGCDIDNIDLFKNLGVVYITLCHNGSNDICDSAKGEPIHGGISTFGQKVIERMNMLGITIDISHSSEKSTHDALKYSKQPIIASHSSCKALCNHPRNLSDTTIKAIAESGGVVQVCGYGGFLKEDGETATIFDLIDHIEHIIALTGYDYVGIGSDFDGGGGVIGFDGANNFINITVELLRRGHSDENIAKILGENILRVISQNCR